MTEDDWFLDREERGNPASRIDTRHDGDAAWSRGNTVRPIPHGAPYFTELLARVGELRAGDLLLFTDWRGDPSERLDGSGTEVAAVFADAARRGVVVKGLLWRSHWDRLRFSEEENRHLGEMIEAAGGECLRDMRVPPGGSHHQKLVVLRHRDDPRRDIAYVGGIDLCWSRRDDASHLGDPQAAAMAGVYGPRPPWHDVQAAIQGPAVGDVEAVFRERWEDPTPLTRNPVHRIADLVRREDTVPDPLPPQSPDPPACGPHSVQLLRTYAHRRTRYPFAPQGERSVARGYLKALRRARALIYIEDQYLWSPQVAECFAEALEANPGLRMISILPLHPDQDGAFQWTPQILGRDKAVSVLRRAGGDRFAVYGVENGEGTPVYVHAKVCVIDDVWATIGSDNFNRRSWTYDSELTCATLDETRDGREPADPGGLGDGARRFARDLRLTLAREHLDRPDVCEADLLDPRSFFEVLASSAADLERWHAGGRRGPRPPGRLRVYEASRMAPWKSAWATPFYHLVCDPDGRPRPLRRAGRY
ncbi:phosphatidylserine/phosphatidylglycerophosphate/cardiolipin synthase-like enzyme [Streptosporangium becharense]|uniref:Phosphatidylserine/phosphatidylglycerophosphate/ cardiolipin synthase-like enzyme n=1 Tax=Streptosporangium becharense TaxID=1816182 RepID=A0A7W9IN66_9ACTN|nr:phospholipase D family protein [Streptosporangium becharense]MBB2914571.1 phosphatidylserine/phosphatidylglycerophosphate/cardiolipin synthase-like enzyme [Streptosporangium becharense]MBB5823416.1 phosphatidylserine/phosphatidylglycerophosphate/cardiolipin synthase-like enzyme [Streptosporangium becharense]